MYTATSQPPSDLAEAFSFQLTGNKQNFVVAFKTENEKREWQQSINTTRDKILSREVELLRAQRKNGPADKAEKRHRRRSSM